MMMTDVENVLVAYLRTAKGPVPVDDIAEHLGKYIKTKNKIFTRSGVRTVIMRINSKMPNDTRIVMVEGGRGKGKAAYQLTTVKK